MALGIRSLLAFTIRIFHLLPSLLVVLLWMLIYEVWPFMRVEVCMCVIPLDCLFRSGSSQHSPVIEVAVIPFEIDVPRHLDLDDYAFPFGFVVLHVIFEDPDVVFANGRCE